MAKNELHTWSGTKWLTIKKVHGEGSGLSTVKKIHGWTGTKWEYLWPPISTPTSHTITLAGHRSGTSRWTFSTASYKGHITRATIIIHSRHLWSGHAVGYPSGGTLTPLLHIPSGGGTKTHSVSAAKFNGATRGVTLDHTLGTTTSVDRVSLRITYTK